MAGVWELAKKHDKELGLGVFLKLTEGVLNASPQDRQDKVTKAYQLGFPKGKIEVAYRPDLPIFAKSFEFYDLKEGVRELDSEMERWRLLLNDWRFATIKAQWLNGSKSSLEALAATENLLHNLDQLFRLQNSNTVRQHFQLDDLALPPVEIICSLSGAINNQKIPGNSFFIGIENNVKKFDLEGDNADRYRYYVGMLYWYFFAEDALQAEQRTEVRNQHLLEFQKKEETVLKWAIKNELKQQMQNIPELAQRTEYSCSSKQTNSKSESPYIAAGYR
jgi:hypothetical protein